MSAHAYTCVSLSCLSLGLDPSFGQRRCCFYNFPPFPSTTTVLYNLISLQYRIQVTTSCLLVPNHCRGRLFMAPASARRTMLPPHIAETNLAALDVVRIPNSSSHRRRFRFRRIQHSSSRNSPPTPHALPFLDDPTN